MVRIANNLDAKPLIVLNREYNYDDDEKVIVGQELWLFNVFLLWGWIS